MATTGGRATATTTSLHLHADATNTAAHTSSSSHSTAEYVSVPIDLRRLDQASAGPPSSMGVRSVVVTMSPNSERLARDTTSDDVEFAAGHLPFSTGQAVLDDGTDPADSSAGEAGTNRFANRFTGTARGASEVGDNYCYDSTTAGSEKFGLLCNLGRAAPALDLRATDELVLHVSGQSPVTITLAQVAASTNETFPRYLHAVRSYPFSIVRGTGALVALFADKLYRLDPSPDTLPNQNVYGTTTADTDGKLVVTRSAGTFKLHCNGNARLADIFGLPLDAAAADALGFSNTLQGTRRLSEHEEAQVYRFEYGDGTTTTTTTMKTTHVLGLLNSPSSRYKAYNHAVADGQQVQLDAHSDPFVLPSGIAEANKIVDGSNKESDTTSTAVLYARNVVVPTDVENVRGTRALMFFNTYADATADYATDAAMATRAVDIGPTGFTNAERAAMEGFTVTGTLDADFGASGGSAAVGHVLTILNRSVLELRASWDYIDEYIDGDGVIKLQYVGSHAPPSSSSSDPQPIFFAKRIDGDAGLGTASDLGSHAQVRVVLFNTEAEARKPLSDYTVDTTAADGTATHKRAQAYACAKAAVRLVQPVVERASGETTTSRRHAFAEPLYASERLLSQGVQSLNHIDPSDASPATLIKLTRPTTLRGGDEVLLQPVLEGEEGQYGGTQYKFGQSRAHYAHALDPAPDGEAQYLAYTGVSIDAGQIPAEGAVAYVGAEVDDDLDHLGVRLYSSREAALAKDERQGLSLNAYRAYAAGRGIRYGNSYTLQGRLRLVRRRASSTWTCLYAEIGGCSAGSAGVISTDPYVSNTGNHVVAVPRSLTNRLYPVDVELPIDAVDRRGFLKLWVVEHDGRRRRPVFPDDLERIDVLVDIHHRRAPLSEEERRRRYQAFVAEVVSGWGGGESDSSSNNKVLEPFAGPGTGRRAF